MDLILCRQRVHVNLKCCWQTVKLFQPSSWIHQYSRVHSC